MAGEIVTTWFGAFLVRDGRVVSAFPAPKDAEALAERMSVRRAGGRTAEEDQLLTQAGAVALRSRDRRLLGPTVALGGDPAAEIDPNGYGFTPERLRAAVIAVAERSLTTQWDPSVHVEEAVRSLTDLDATLNLIGERVAQWAAHDIPLSEGEGGESARRAAHGLVDEARVAGPLGPSEPELTRARRALAGLYLETERTRRELEAAVESAMPRRAPNLTALLGALLAARLLSQAGGLDRLARLPASTIQVLGAERAFFEHLRGRAPPPRHGLLFLHPTIQGAPRRQRGRLARALAGKAAIAARMDREGAALRPELKGDYETRARAIRSAGERPRKPRRSGTPLDRAAEDG